MSPRRASLRTDLVRIGFTDVGPAVEKLEARFNG